MKLSICTPTWNREKFLRESLTETLSQVCSHGLTEQVEICISDNGSTDETPEVIKSVQRAFPDVSVKVNRFDSNQGYSINMDAAIRCATGEFIFLNGDDDIFNPNGVERLLQQCETITSQAVLIKNLWDSDGLMDWETMTNLPKDECIDFENVFEATQTLGRLFPTFIGNFIMRRDAYVSHFHSKYLDSIYPHTAILFEILRSRPVEFRNFTCVTVDDSDRYRSVGPCAARGASIDAAMVFTEGVLLQQRDWRSVLRYYRLFLKVIPRAVINEKQGLCKKRESRYALLTLRNVFHAYRASLPAMVLAGFLYALAKATPQRCIRWILERRVDRN